MTEALIPVAIFLLLLVCLASALKWFKLRAPGVSAHDGGQAKFISALAVGPHQRVVTVEVGPVGQRVWLTLGVTAQGISSLHCATVAASPRDDLQQNPALRTKDLT